MTSIGSASLAAAATAPASAAKRVAQDDKNHRDSYPCCEKCYNSSNKRQRQQSSLQSSLQGLPVGETAEVVESGVCIVTTAPTCSCASQDHQQQQHTTTSAILLSIPDEIMAQIMMTATHDPTELRGLETSCKTLCKTIDRCWRVLVEQFYPNVVIVDSSTSDTNVDNINVDSATWKDLWIEGRTLESLSVNRCQYVYMRNTDHDVFREGVFFGSNKSILVMSSSDHYIPPVQPHPSVRAPDQELQLLLRQRRRRVRRRRNFITWSRGGFLPPNPIRIRDARTLEILANMDGSPNHKAVDVIGPAGNEVIVEYLDHCLKAFRNCKLVWEHHWHSSSTFAIESGCPWPPPSPEVSCLTDRWCMLPSEKTLLVIRDQQLHVFFIKSNSLPFLACVISLGEVESPTVNWIKEGLEFILHVRPGEITFWSIDHEAFSVSSYRIMRLSENKLFNYIYTSAKHLVAAGSPGDDAIYVFDRRGCRLHKLLEDIPKPFAHHRWSPMNACIVQGGGCLMVSNSLMGAALCVWNLRTGLLVHRFEQSIDHGHCFRPGHHFTDGTWIHCLDQLPAFDFPMYLMADNDGSLFSWGFPADNGQRERIQSLQTLASRENR